MGIHILDTGKLRVAGPEIMAPLRDAVCLVDGEKRNRQRPRPTVHLEQQTLGRDV